MEFYGIEIVHINCRLHEQIVGYFITGGLHFSTLQCYPQALFK
jgi:hypothetical protein